MPLIVKGREQEASVFGHWWVLFCVVEDNEVDCLRMNGGLVSVFGPRTIVVRLCLNCPCDAVYLKRNLAVVTTDRLLSLYVSLYFGNVLPDT